MPPPLPNRRSFSQVDADGKQDLVSSLRQLRDCPFYWGPLDKDAADSKLANQPDGVFLLRDSSDDRHFFAMSFRMAERTHHVRISYSGGMFCFDNIQSAGMRKPSILELIHATMSLSRNGQVQYFVRGRVAGEPPAPVKILYPISRNHVAHSLLHLCRFTILKHTRLDHIDTLPIPTTLKDYLKEAQYYCEDILHQPPICDVSKTPPPPPLPRRIVSL